jgi:hypothetical protein
MTLLTLSFGQLPRQVRGGRFWTLLSNLTGLPPPSLADDEDPAHVWSPQYQDFIAQCLRKDPNDRLTCQELLFHPFLKQAVLDSSNQADIARLGAAELRCILQSLCVHLETRDQTRLEVLIILVRDSDKEERGSFLPLEDTKSDSDSDYTTLDHFTMTVSETMRVLLLDQYPSRVTARVALLAMELSDSEVMGAGGGELEIVNCFSAPTRRDDSNNGHVDTYTKHDRLSALATQLHLPLDTVTSIARDFLEIHFN